ncbi:MAG: YtxH domain-containing protein, partial [Brevefilum sp.]
RKFGNLMFGAILGGLIGSALALWFAPAPGEKTRNEIEAYFNNLQEEVSRAADEKRAELEAQLNKMRSGENVTIEGKKA